MSQNTFELELQSLINRYNKEKENNTPDFLLANYLSDCLDAYNKVVTARDRWFSVDMWSPDKRSKDYHEFKKSGNNENINS